MSGLGEAGTGGTARAGQGGWLGMGQFLQGLRRVVLGAVLGVWEAQSL